MPVAAVAVAAIAIGTAVELGTTVAIIAAVGATIGAVGAVTGNKTLAIVGGVIGAVGAIGGLAASAGLLDGAGIFGSQAGSALADTAAGTSAAETASPFTAAASGVPSDAGTFAGAAAGGSGIDSEIASWSQYGAISGANPATGTTDIINSVSGNISTVGDVSPGATVASTDVNPLGTVQANAASPTVTPTTATDTGAVSGSASATNDTFGTETSAVAPSTPPTPGAPVAPSGTYGAPTGMINTDPFGKAIGSGAGTAVQGAQPSTWNSIFNILGKPGVGTLASGLIQAGGAFIAGATSSLTPAQVAALQAQAQANTSASNLYNQQAALAANQVANLKQPLPVATRTAPVTGAPSGLINQPPPQQPQQQGVAA